MPRTRKKYTVYRFGAVVLLAALAALGNASGDEPLRTLDEIVATLERSDASGHVVDTQDNRVASAEVYAYFSHGKDGVRDRFIGKTVTDANGRFAFEKAIVWEPELPGEGRAPQRHIFLAKHPDLGIDFEIVLEQDPTDNITITLFGSITEEITVQDAESNPIPGAKVYLCGGRHREAVEESYERQHRYFRLHKDIGLSSGTTDDNGKVVLEGPRNPTFWVEKEGYTRGWRRGTIDLFPAAHVSGKVTFEDGAPAPGMMVAYVYHGQNLYYDEITLTDETGRYAFDDAPGAGFYYSWTSDASKEQEKKEGGYSELKVTDLRPGSPFISKGVTFDVKPGDTLVKDLTLQRACELAGTVVDLTTGEPAPNMRMHLYIQTGRRILDSKDVKADEAGNFSAVVAPGSEVRIQWEGSREDGDYLIDGEWRNQGNWQAYQGVVQEDITDLKLAVKLVPVRQVTGRVLDEKGQGAKDATVYVHSELPGVKTDDSGAFMLKTVPKGSDVELFAVIKDNALAGLVRLKEGATETTIPLESTRSYEGQVLTTDELPAADLKFYLDLHLNDSSIYRVREEPHTDAEGKFTVDNLHAKATYYGWWSSDNEDNRDYDWGNVTIELAKLKPDEPIQFEAKRFLNALFGRVVNEQGEPVEGAKIEIYPWDIRPQNCREEKITTDGNGEFIVNFLAPGEVRLRVVAQGYKIVSAKAPTDTVDFEAVLKAKSAEGSVYHVTAVDENQKPVRKVPVTLKMRIFKEDGHETAEPLTAKTDKKGKAEIVFKAGEDDMGRGLIGCDIEGYDLVYSSVSLDEDAEITLVLTKGECWNGSVVDENQHPIPNAQVKVTSMGQGEGQDWYRRARFGDESGYIFTTDEQGRFELARFSVKNQVSFKISAPGYADRDGYFHPTQDSKNVFALLPGAAAKGKVVVKETGELLASAEVWLRGAQSRRWKSDTPGDGTFSRDGLAPGQYTVTFYSKDPEARKYVLPGQLTFTLAAGETADIVVEVEEGVPVKGELLDAATGMVPEGSGAIYTPEAETRPRYSARIEKDGSWLLYVPPGTYDIMYRVEGMEQAETFKSITVERGKPVDELIIEVETRDEPSTTE